MKKNYFLLGLLVVFLFLCAGVSIDKPRPVMGFKTGDKGHAKITREGLEKIDVVIDGVHHKFTEKAIEEIIDANEWVDTKTGFGLIPFTDHMHFDDELLEEGSKRISKIKDKVIEHTKKRSGEDAREALGAGLHTLQDFYAHSNFVELKIRRKAPSIDWGKTILNNPSRSKVFCYFSLLRFGTFLTNYGYEELTTGYYAWNKLDDSSNPGKCAHGHAWYDVSGIPSLNGIAKDEPDTKDDVGNDLYLMAITEATNATTQFVNSILNADGIKNNPKAIRSLMGISGGSITFVVDVTASMEDDIAIVKEQMIEFVKAAKKDPTLEPEDYILVLFGDPYIAEALKTTDADEFIRWISGITTSGGGDCPEFSMSGLRIAVEASSEGSNIFLFTDAGAKDAYLKETVYAEAKKKNVVISNALTGFCSSVNKESTHRPEATFQQTQLEPSFSELDFQIATYDPIYDEIARETGGEVYLFKKNELGRIFKILEVTSNRNLNTILLRNISVSSTLQSFMFPVDTTVTKLAVSVSGQNLTAISLTNPSGVSIDAMSATTVTVQTYIGGKLYVIDQPPKGEWKVAVKGNGNASIKAMATSNLFFYDYRFLEPSVSRHDSFLPIGSQPVISNPYIIDAKFIGDVKSVSFKAVGENGETLNPNLNLVQTSVKNYYRGSILVPSQTFRIVSYGLDSNGAVFERVHTPLYTGQLLELTIDYGKTLQESSKFSDTLPVYIVIRNHGLPDSFTLSASAIGTKITTIEPSEINLAKGISQTVLVKLAYPITTSINVPIAWSFTARPKSVATQIATITDQFLLPGILALPASVTLGSFTAQYTDEGNRLNWITLSEIDTWSFSVFRAEGTFNTKTIAKSAEQVNTESILAKGRGNGGASYLFYDTSAYKDKKYTYWLVETEMDGKNNVYGPAEWVGGIEKIYFPFNVK